MLTIVTRNFFIPWHSIMSVLCHHVGIKYSCKCAPPYPANQWSMYRYGGRCCLYLLTPPAGLYVDIWPCNGEWNRNVLVTTTSDSVCLHKRLLFHVGVVSSLYTLFLAIMSCWWYVQAANRCCICFTMTAIALYLKPISLNVDHSDPKLLHALAQYHECAIAVNALRRI